MKFENLEVLVSDLPRAEEISYRQLHKDYRNVRVLRVVLITLLLLVAGIAVVSFTGNFTNAPSWIVMTAVVALYCISSILMVYAGYPRKGYALRQHDIAYRTGYLFHVRTIMPFNRIQHCEISQGPLEKMFDLCSLNIYTAGGSGSDLVIPGLGQDDAETLRAYILKISDADAG